MLREDNETPNPAQFATIENQDDNVSSNFRLSYSNILRVNEESNNGLMLGNQSSGGSINGVGSQMNVIVKRSSQNLEREDDNDYESSPPLQQLGQRNILVMKHKNNA